MDRLRQNENQRLEHGVFRFRVLVEFRSGWILIKNETVSQLSIAFTWEIDNYSACAVSPEFAQEAYDCLKKISVVHKICEIAASSSYLNISTAARFSTMITGSKTASGAYRTSFWGPSRCLDAIEQPDPEFKMPAENF